MNFYDLHSQVFVHKNNGQIWNFHISNNSIFYTIVVNNTPIKKVKLIDNIKTYDVSMDTDDNIDLVCVKNNNELIYFKNSSNSWKRKTFKKTNSKSDIDFVNILNIKNSIHIFYAFRNPAENKPYKVFHIYSHYNQWKYNYLAPVMITKNIKPYFVDYNRNGEILFLYKFNANTKNRGKIYVKTFNDKKNRWSSAVNLKFENASTKILNLLVDSKDKVHFVFKENNSVNYLGQHFNDFNNMTGSLKLDEQISLGNMPGTTYHLFEVDGNLLISWKNNRKLYHLCPKTQANDWTEIELSESNEILNVKYLGSLYKGKSVLKPLVTFGVTRNNETLLLGLDKDFLAQEDTKVNEPNNDIDKAWYGDDDDDEILDLIDKPSAEGEVNEIENDLIYADKNNNTESKINELTSYVDNELPNEVDNLVAESEVEKDIILEGEEIDNSLKIAEPVSYIDNDLQQDKEPDYTNISNNEVTQDQYIAPAKVEGSEKVDDEIVDESMQDEVKNPTKKSIFERMKDFLTSN